MNAERLIRLVVNMVLRRGMRQLTRGQKASPQARQAQKSMKTLNRVRRM